MQLSFTLLRELCQGPSSRPEQCLAWLLVWREKKKNMGELKRKGQIPASTDVSGSLAEGLVALLNQFKFPLVANNSKTLWPCTQVAPNNLQITPKAVTVGNN